MRVVAFLCVFFCVACGGASDSANDPAQRNLSQNVASTDFALLPCAEIDRAHPCALLMAGGKRVLLGAPEGVRRGLSTHDLENLDAVMLFSLRSEDIEGLDAVRNATWQAGRDQQLPVAGPAGVSEVIAALNTAYEVSDAIAYVEGVAKGAYDVALLGAVESKGNVFDTGDLTIKAGEDAAGNVLYDVKYNDARAVIMPCPHDLHGQIKPTDNFFVLDCEVGSATWPVEKVIYIQR